MTVTRPGWLQLPGLALLRTYERPWLAKDVVAGLVLTAVLVPVGMGYAEAAGLPAITGLYATIVPLLVYAALGPSRILVLGRIRRWRPSSRRRSSPSPRAIGTAPSRSRGDLP